METFRLTNLRELSTEEQLRINGGMDSTGCKADCGACTCPCKCNSKNPSKSVGESNADSGDNSALAQRKVTAAMQSM